MTRGGNGWRLKDASWSNQNDERRLYSSHNRLTNPSAPIFDLWRIESSHHRKATPASAHAPLSSTMCRAVQSAG